MSSRDVLKIFWPSHIHSLPGAQKSTGYMIGWFNSPNTVCIAAVIEEINYQDLKGILSAFDDSHRSEFAHINRVCKSPPTILGIVMQGRRDAPSLPSNDQDTWLTVTLDNSYMPVPLSIYHRDQQHSLQYYEVIFYNQPNPKRLQFLALDPLDLDISGQEPIDERLRDEKYRTSLQNLRKVTGYSHALNGHDACSVQNLESTLTQINSSFYVEKGVQKLKVCRLNGDHRAPSNVTLYVKNAIKFFVRIIAAPIALFGRYLRWILMCPCLCIMFILLSLAELTLHVLNMRLPKFLLNAVAIKDLSTAGQQIDLRLQQLYFWPRQYTLLRRKNWANTAKARAYYISFHNSMWLVANDIIIGLAIGTFLSTNRYIMSYLLHKVLHEYTVESLKSRMLWFLESPAGLKLNHELGSFLSELFLWLIRFWTQCMQSIEPYTPQIIHIIGISGIFGVSMVISLFSDLLAFMTLHVYCFYMVAARIFNWQLIILYSLFNLFRGKKRNMLRNRIDACDYDLDQLLPGTCLFTLLTFLFPTVLVYYLTFAMSRASVIVLQAIMETLLAFFNHFPLFAILLRFKDPDRLPGGLEFEIVETDYMMRKHHPFRYYWNRMRGGSSDTTDYLHHRRHRHDHHRYQRRRKKSVHFHIPNNKNKDKSSTQPPIDSTHGAYLHMQNLPISLGAICFQYMMLWKRLSAHYFSAYYFKCFLYGEPIKPIPKLQYPMLPESRPPLSAVWKLLKSTLWDTNTT